MDAEKMPILAIFWAVGAEKERGSAICAGLG